MSKNQAVKARVKQLSCGKDTVYLKNVCADANQVVIVSAFHIQPKGQHLNLWLVNHTMILCTDVYYFSSSGCNTSLCQYHIYIYSALQLLKPGKSLQKLLTRNINFFLLSTQYLMFGCLAITRLVSSIWTSSVSWHIESLILRMGFQWSILNAIIHEKQTLDRHRERAEPGLNENNLKLYKIIHEHSIHLRMTASKFDGLAFNSGRGAVIGWQQRA